jgi:hypothetical protein
MKGNFSRWLPPRTPMRRSMRCAQHRAAARPRRSVKSRTQPAAAVLVTTRYGGGRIVDMLVGDPLPRIC